jgi:TolB protein
MFGQQSRAMGLASVALVAAASIAGTGPASAAVPGGNGQIVFSSEPSATTHGQLFSVRPDGSDLHQLTRFTNSDAQHASWSATGSRLVFERDFANRAVIEMRNGDRGALTLLIPHGLQGMPAYSPDGRTIVFDRTLPREDALWIMRADGTKLRQLTHDPPSGAGECRCESSPVFSPDGTRVAFVRHVTDTKTAAFVVNVDGSGLEQLTPWRLGVSDKLDWSPDGSRILISAPPVERADAATNVYTVHPDGSGLTQITHETTPGVDDIAECFSPDGTKIVVAKAAGDGPARVDRA